MTGFLLEYVGFLAKIITCVVAFAVIVGIVCSGKSGKKPKSEDGVLHVRLLNDFYSKLNNAVARAMMSKADFKAMVKSNDKLKKSSKASHESPKIFVIDFLGDVQASAVESMRNEITALLSCANKFDEIVVRLESPGGYVHDYGLAASQLARIRDAGIPLTICVDKVAASGGYLMACIGNKILCAPFAILGSIGVVVQFPNVNRLLKKHDIDVELIIAGDHKRTLTMIGENTEAGRAKFKEEMTAVHTLFKNFVSKYRPMLDIETIATGESWHGIDGIEKLLADQILTSDEYLCEKAKNHDLIHLRFSYPKKRSLKDVLGMSAVSVIEKVLAKISNRVLV